MVMKDFAPYFDFETKVKITTADAQSFMVSSLDLKMNLTLNQKKTSWNLMSATAML